jgi:FKBP-type peptidyl-prolyl cis-trans isomerase SlyD
MSLEMPKVITFNYTLKDESFLKGSNQVLPRLEEALDEMIIGSKKNVKIPAKEAYGEYSDNAIQTLRKEQFPDGANLNIGISYVANSPDGKQMPFVITDVKENDVTVDFNHPLAGKDLEFDVELVDKRDATPEEVQHGHVHGPGGHHH